MKKILLLASVVFGTSLATAQKFDQRTSLWAKSDKVQQNKQILSAPSSSHGLVTDIKSGYSNFYLVFKSQESTPTDLLNFTFTCTQHAVTTHNLNHSAIENIDLKRKTGAIVKYGFNYPNASGDKNYVTIIDNPNDLTDVYEVIYINEEFSELDHQQIQTYLSLKYGISLIEPGNYVDANGKSIWNKFLNPNYNKFITGLGKSDYFSLNKTQTINSLDNRIELETNSFDNNDYLMIGTNNQNLNFKNENGYEILDSSWLVQISGGSKLATLKFNLGLNLHNEGVYELLINQKDNDFRNNENVVRVEGRKVGNQLVFENVYFDNDDNGFDTFTIGYSAKTSTEAKPVIVSRVNVNAYPNPASLNEDVIVDYEFDKPTNLKIHVFTVDGKFIGKEEQNNVEKYQFKQKFTSSGVYLIVSTYEGQLSTNRIIVK